MVIKTEYNIPVSPPAVYKYETQSLDEFACALALGAEVTRVDKDSDPRFFTFYLNASFDMEKMRLALASKTLEINAYNLCDAIRRAKAIIHRRL